MDDNETMMVYLHRLENQLDNDFAAQGDNLAAKTGSIRSLLPDELHALLRDIDTRATQLKLSARNDGAGLADFAFHCGRAGEQLKALRQNRAAESVAALQINGLPPDGIEKTELDAVARFIAARDRILRVVADFTLKVLLILVGLLILAVVLGLV
jgi:hypothetical protein